LVAAGNVLQLVVTKKYPYWLRARARAASVPYPARTGCTACWRYEPEERERSGVVFRARGPGT